MNSYTLLVGIYNGTTTVEHSLVISHQKFAYSISSHIIEGVQNEPPQNMSLQHVDYFELKAMKTQQTQEKHLPLPQSPKRI